MPKRSRFAVTIATGALATIADMFPAIAMKLLGFVALYGMLLMPMGAVVFVDFWLMRKFSMQSNYAEFSKKTFNWAVGLTWLLALCGCWFMVKYAGFQIFFVSLPGWLIVAVLYLLVSKIYQKNIRKSFVE